MPPQGRSPRCLPPKSLDAQRVPGSEKEVPANAHHPPDSGEPFSTTSHPAALGVAGILDSAPASTVLRSAPAIHETASSDEAKTVKREMALQAGAAAQAKVTPAAVAPQRLARAAEQPGALARQMCWREVQFEMGRALSLPRQLPLRAQLFPCDTGAQPRPAIPAADSSHRQLGDSSLPAPSIPCGAFRPAFCLPASGCAGVSGPRPYRHGEAKPTAAICGLAVDARLRQHLYLARINLSEESVAQADRRKRLLAAASLRPELEDAASSTERATSSPGGQGRLLVQSLT